MNKRTIGAAAQSAIASAANLYLPDGACHQVSSNKDAPIVGTGNPNKSPDSDNLPGQLDLIPGHGDQYGAPCAAEHSPTLLPCNCP